MIVIKLDKTLLVPNEISPRLYGECSFTNDQDQALYMSIVNSRVIQTPIKINKNNIVIDGVRRLWCANMIDWMTEVPVIIEDIEDNEIDEYKVVEHQIQRVKTDVQVAIEYQIISERYDSTSGRANYMVKELRNRLIDSSNTSDTKVQKLLACNRWAMEIYGLSKEESWNYIKNKLNGKTSVNFLHKTTKSAYKEMINGKKAKEIELQDDDYFHIIHHDSSDLSDILEDESVNNVTCSSPYFDMKIYSEDGVMVKTVGRRKNDEQLSQLGQEKSIDDFVEGVVKILNECKRTLTKDGNIFLNIMDSYIDNIQQRIPDKIINEFTKDNDIHYVQTLNWYKRNPLPDTYKEHIKRFQNTKEDIIHFVKDKKGYKWRKNWFGKEEDFFSKITFGGEGKEKLFRTVIIYPEQYDNIDEQTSALLQTTTSNTSYLQKLLKKKGLHLQHNALYPLEVPLVLVMTTTDPGDTVLDPWSGMATTGLAAYANNCIYYGVDISQVYSAKASIRVRDFIEKNPHVHQIRDEIIGD